MDRMGDASEPLHARIAAHLRRDVREGVYARGQRLPAEIELARQLGVSRGTLRQAFTTLLGEGIIETVPGRGTFVAGQSAQRAAGLVGMLLPSVVRARNPELIGGAEETLRQVGYSLVLGVSGDDPSLESEQLLRIIEQGASGLIVYTVDGSRDMPVLRRLVTSGFPVVLIDRYIPDLAVDTVTMDNIGGGFLATGHLAELGYRRIGYIGTDNVNTSSIVERTAGYRWALAQYGLDWTADLECTDVKRLLAWPPCEPEKQRHNERVLRAFLTRPAAPDAVFVCNDFVAFQVVEVARGLGRRIPDDLALVGFDNVSYRDYFGVALTTVEQHRHTIGATAASLVIERMAGRRTEVERFVIATSLVVRRSSIREQAAAQPNHLQKEAIAHASVS
jgi:GntR family transcriptional regulator of arabinose operon